MENSHKIKPQPAALDFEKPLLIFKLFLIKLSSELALFLLWYQSLSIYYRTVSVEHLLHYDLILLARPLPSLTNNRIRMMPTNVPLSRAPTRWGYLICESGPFYVISFHLFSTHYSQINWRVGLRCLHTSIFISRRIANQV